MYQKEQFQPGDLIRSDWANKLENAIYARKSFIGSFDKFSSLPNQLLLENGQWQVVWEEAQIYVVKNGVWEKLKQPVTITLTGDVEGSGTQNDGNVQISTVNKFKVTSIRLTGEVVGQQNVINEQAEITTSIPNKLSNITLTGEVQGSGTVVGNSVTISTQISNKLRNIQLTGEVVGSGTVQNDTVQIQTSIPNKLQTITLTGDVQGYANVTGNSVQIQTSLANSVLNQLVRTDGSVSMIMCGYDSQKPQPQQLGRVYIQIDTKSIYVDTGTAWVIVAYQPGYVYVYQSPVSFQNYFSSVTYLYTTKVNSTTYIVRIANPTSQTLTNFVVAVPTNHLEIQSPNESLKIATGYSYYIEQYGQDRSVVGNVVLILIPEIPANSELAIPVEKTPNFQPNPQPFFGTTQPPTFYRNSPSWDESELYLLPWETGQVRTVPVNKPKFAFDGIIIEPASQNLLNEQFATLNMIPVGNQLADVRCGAYIIQPSLLWPTATIVFYLGAAITAYQPFPNYRTICAWPTYSGVSVGVQYLYNSAINATFSAFVRSNNNSIVSRFVGTASSISWVLWATLPKVEYGRKPTSFVPAGQNREPDYLFIKDLQYKIPPSNVTVEVFMPTILIGTFGTVLYIGTPDRYVKVSINQPSSNAAQVQCTLETYTFNDIKRINSVTVARDRLLLSLQINPTNAVLFVTTNSTQTSVTAQWAQQVMRGDVYIGWDPYTPESHVCSPISHFTIYNGLRRAFTAPLPSTINWPIDGNVLYYMPLQNHTLPIICRL